MDQRGRHQGSVYRRIWYTPGEYINVRENRKGNQEWSKLFYLSILVCFRIILNNKILQMRYSIASMNIRRELLNYQIIV